MISSAKNLKKTRYKKPKRILMLLLVFLIFLSTGNVNVYARDETTSYVHFSDMLSHEIGPSIDRNTWTYAQEQLYVQYYNALVYYGNNIPDAINKLNQLENDQSFIEYRDRYYILTGEFSESLLYAAAFVREYQPENSDVNSARERLKSALDELLAFSADINSTYSSENAGRNTGDIFQGWWGTANWLWDYLGSCITGATNGYFLNISDSEIIKYSETFSAAITAIAYMVAVILFAVNITETSLQFELMTLKGGVKVFGRLILVKFWIDFSVNICKWILMIINSAATSIMSSLSSTSSSFLSSPSVELGVSDIPVIGAIVDIITGALFWLPLVIIAITIIVCLIAILVKLVVRNFELACLMTVSPIFFATLVGDSTKSYFQKFITAFLSTCATIFFIAIVYIIGTQWISSFNAANPLSNEALNLTNFASYFPKFLVRVPIIIGMARVICKPPRALSGLIS